MNGCKVRTMRAAVCYEPGKPLIIEDIDIDPPQSGEVKVRLVATAICHSDIHALHGDWNGKFPVVVEVLSDSTEGKDRIRKANLYHACPTIQEYVLIATKYQAVEVQRRAGDEWTLHLFGPDDEIELASLGIRFPLSILYRGTVVPEMLNGQNESA